MGTPRARGAPRKGANDPRPAGLRPEPLQLLAVGIGARGEQEARRHCAARPAARRWRWGSMDINGATPEPPATSSKLTDEFRPQFPRSEPDGQSVESSQLVCIDNEGDRHQTVTRRLITDARYGAVQLDVVGMGVPKLRHWPATASVPVAACDP